MLGLGILEGCAIESRFAGSFSRGKKEMQLDMKNCPCCVLEEGHENGLRAETMNCDLRQVLAAILKGFFLYMLGFDLFSRSISSFTGAWGIGWRHKEEPSLH